MAIRPEAPFKPVFEMATMREGSGIVLVKQSDLLDNNEGGPGPEMASPAITVRLRVRGGDGGGLNSLITTRFL